MRLPAVALGVGLFAGCLAAHGQTSSTSSAVSYNQVGHALMDRMRFSEAADYLRQAIAIDPAYEPAHRNLSLTFYQLGQNEDALTEGYAALRLDSSDAYAYIAAAKPLAVRGYYSQAIVLGGDAVQLRPSDPVLAADYGEILAGAGRYADAVKSYRSSLRADPRFSVAYNGLGQVYSALGRYGDAVHYLRKAVALVPDYGLAHYNLGGAYLHIGRLAAARKEWIEAEKSSDPTVADWGGQMLLKYKSRGR